MRVNLIHDGGEYSYADMLLLLILLGCTFACSSKGRLKERYVNYLSRKCGASSHEPMIVPVARNVWCRHCTDVSQDIIYVGLRFFLGAGPFGYLLCVRGKDLA